MSQSKDIQLNNAPKSESSHNNNNSVDKKKTNGPQSKADSKAQKSSKKDDSYKSRCQRVIRTRPHLFIIFVVSVVGFGYHFNLALHQYWDYKTTGNLGILFGIILGILHAQ